MSEEEQTAEQKSLNDAELKELATYLAASGSTPQPEEKYNVHLFLHRVATADDTTKVGNINEEELGKPKYPERVLKELQLISDEILENTELGKYFAKEAEILTSTSLSKEGFLVRQGTTTTRQIADVTKKKPTQNKSWFKKKEPVDTGEHIQ